MYLWLTYVCVTWGQGDQTCQQEQLPSTSHCTRFVLKTANSEGFQYFKVNNVSPNYLDINSSEYLMGNLIGSKFFFRYLVCHILLLCFHPVFFQCEEKWYPGKQRQNRDQPYLLTPQVWVLAGWSQSMCRGEEARLHWSPVTIPPSSRNVKHEILTRCSHIYCYLPFTSYTVTVSKKNLNFSMIEKYKRFATTLGPWLLVLNDSRQS